MITVLTCRGTGEPLGASTNLLTAVTRRLDPDKYVLGPDVDYPASVGPINPRRDLGGCSERQSVEVGVVALAAAIRRAPTKVGLLGYSLGAQVLTRFLEAKARGEFPDCELVWSATIANPLRREGDSIDPSPTGFGINGQRGEWPGDIFTWEVACPLDPITSCPADSPLRNLADAVSAFGFAELGGWSLDLADRLRRNRWQPNRIEWWRHPMHAWDQWSRAAALIEGYLLAGTHTTAYIDNGYCARLAAILDAHG
ncbi:PE-PPE domain-containing protein [Nocardia sp. CDC159]|uniref:PE-PPE domain-containing protein n=1 Tax=Nocardia pulmonis TaxID=2951408 RepID=A0A9X2IZ94_9NOCA|nr:MULTISPECIES: PE-PPE domain-containing protein [Nocardia]MCM6777263.1 PE-PPE domain-containing protein [Nocardia pulmonis]MCM6790148.1 PE-PPE domain-containing protein [Nocardia sp. CDC159]